MCLLPGAIRFAQAAPQVEEIIPIGLVWSGHPVGFALLTAGEMQYIAYYDENRDLTVASRSLDSKEWKKKILPTKIGWDSHNYVTLALDRAGHLHVSGNMHGVPLIYFRTTVKGDISTLTSIPQMTGKRESQMTYPQFLKNNRGDLIFSYRDGGSGSGDTIYNIYDERLANWKRFFEKPLLDGKGEMNAYPVGPVQGPDGYWHMTWIWRDDARVETNHDLGYARSRDLVHWETVDGKPLSLPLSIKTRGVTVDPIPVNGGFMNGMGTMGFDNRKRVVIAYPKFDKAGLTQFYFARYENGQWNIHCMTQWKERWDFRGGGTGPELSTGISISHSPLLYAAGLGYYVRVNHSHHGRKIWTIDPETLQITGELQPNEVPDSLPEELFRGVAPGMGARFTRDTGTPPTGKEYVLHWQTLPPNRDLAREGPPPAPSQLQLITLKHQSPPHEP